MIDQQLFLWVLLALLLLLSGSLSASETALFRLSVNQRALASKRVNDLLAAPRELLVSSLLGNLVTNLLYFAFATRLDAVKEGSLASGAVVLAVLLLSGEILPKTLALRSPERVAHWTALPLSGFVRLTQPMRRGILGFLDFEGSGTSCKFEGNFVGFLRAYGGIWGHMRRWTRKRSKREKPPNRQPPTKNK